MEIILSILGFIILTVILIIELLFAVFLWNLHIDISQNRRMKNTMLATMASLPLSTIFMLLLAITQLAFYMVEFPSKAIQIGSYAVIILAQAVEYFTSMYLVKFYSQKEF